MASPVHRLAHCLQHQLAAGPHHFPNPHHERISMGLGTTEHMGIGRSERFEAHHLPHGSVVVHYPSREKVPGSYTVDEATYLAGTLNEWLTNPRRGRAGFMPTNFPDPISDGDRLMAIIDRMLLPEQALDRLEVEMGLTAA